MNVVRHPLLWYVDKLDRREPFAYLSYGDGEFHAMSGERSGAPFTAADEVLTWKVVEEMRASLDLPGTDVYRGTDEFLIAPETYRGNDQHVVRDAHRVAMQSIKGKAVEWVDGTVWDEAVRVGNLGPLLKALVGRQAFVVGCERVCGLPFFAGRYFAVPEKNAVSALDAVEDRILADFRLHRWADPVYVLCCGLSAIPLGVRIKTKVWRSTVLDLGSALDVFAGVGGDRGWRKELYADPERLKSVIDRNLNGVV